MALVRHPNLQNASGHYLEGATVTAVTDRSDDSEANAYTDEDGLTEVTYPVTSGAEGEVDIWVPVGSYETTFGSDTVDTPAVWEAISGDEIANMLTIEDIPGLQTIGHNVRAYGAAGDGVTDDTDAFQAAINAAADATLPGPEWGTDPSLGAGGGVVYVPPPNFGEYYRIESTLTTDTHHSGISGHHANSLRITGQGAGWHSNIGQPKVVFTGAAGAGPMLNCSSVAGFELDHLALGYSDATYDGHLVDITGPFGDSVHFDVHHCAFYGNNGFGDLVSAESAIHVAVVHTGTIRSCSIAGGEVGLRFGTGYCNVVAVRDCVFNHNDDCHIALATGDGESIVVEHCTFEAGLDTPGIHGGEGGASFGGLYSPRISDNWFGDAGAEVDWISGLSIISSGYGGMLVNNRMADTAGGSCFANCDGSWLIMNNSFDSGSGEFDSAVFKGIANNTQLTLIDNRRGVIWFEDESDIPVALNSIHNQGMPDRIGDMLIGDATGYTGTNMQGKGIGVVVGSTTDDLQTGFSTIPALVRTASGNTVLRGVGTGASGSELQLVTNSATPIVKFRADASGTRGVAFNGAAIPSTIPNYTTSNVTTDRTFDANATTLDELADVVGTIIADLIANGLFQ